ncbi:MAG TPA: CHAT domain-containing protein [Bryobacteraceae bacterium]|nr:CHAT domain-containing protein [Bryobacteraceae bacterium]
MNFETLIRFQQGPGGQVNFHLEHPSYWPDNYDHRILSANPQAGSLALLNAARVPEGAVASAGQELFLALCKHDAVKSQLQATLSTAGAAGLRPIGLQVESADADSLPWEALSDGQKFFALNQWPVARLIGPKVKDLVKNYIFEPPLRLGVVLGASSSQPASHISASDEWRSLRRAVESAGAALSLEILVLAAETDVIAEIGQSGLRVKAMAIRSRLQLEQELREFRPNLLHFFCHGVSDRNPYLRLSTALDWDTTADGSIVLEAEDLRQQIDPKQEAWIVVLNCCESAGGSVVAREVRNLAATLIRKGFPAVLGMRESVDSQNARLLAEQFYKDVFEHLAQMPRDDQPQSIDWPSLLVRGRLGLRDRCAPSARPNAAADTKEWTIPAVYMRTEEFLLKRINPRADLTPEQRAKLRAEIQTLQGSRETVQNMPLPETDKQQMLDKIDTQIRLKTDQLK